MFYSKLYIKLNNKTLAVYSVFAFHFVRIDSMWPDLTYFSLFCTHPNKHNCMWIVNSWYFNILEIWLYVPLFDWLGYDSDVLFILCLVNICVTHTLLSFVPLWLLLTCNFLWSKTCNAPFRAWNGRCIKINFGCSVCFVSSSASTQTVIDYFEYRSGKWKQ